MELVVNVKREVLDPVACTLVLVLQPHEKQRVQRVDNEADGEGSWVSRGALGQSAASHSLAYGALGTHVGSLVADRMVAARTNDEVSCELAKEGVAASLLVESEGIALVGAVRVL